MHKYLRHEAGGYVRMAYGLAPHVLFLVQFLPYSILPTTMCSLDDHSVTIHYLPSSSMSLLSIFLPCEHVTGDTARTLDSPQ